MRRPGGWQLAPELVRGLALTLLGLLTLAEALALAALLRNLPHINVGMQLSRTGGLIWAINVRVFARSYWELDGGGPGHRSESTDEPSDFLFPQQISQRLNKGWSPEFLDYLFLAFNTATAFSPADIMVLSRPAKALMMVRSSISLLTIGLVMARGVNFIGN